MTSAALRQRSSAGLLALVYAALVVYASLYPFSGWRWPAGQRAADLLLLPWTRWHDSFDLWSNGLGYLPLGLLLFVAALRAGRHVAAALSVAALGPALLAYGAEVAQHLLPGRHPSLTDWALNAGGALGGALMGAVLHALGLVARWQGLRERWFARQSAGALTLLALWPAALLFPAPAPLALGQIGPWLAARLAGWLEGVPWAVPLQQALATPAPQTPLGPLAETVATALGLLAPCLVAYSVAAPGVRRAVLALGALALGTAVLTLSTALNYGPQNALAWLTPQTPLALATALLAAALLAWLGRRLIAAIGLVALTTLVALVAQAPTDPYFALSLQAWEQGRFVRFHGLSQWLGWLWPYAALAWLLARVSARD
jgi:VanZ family protein